MQAHENKWVFPKDTPEGKRMRAILEKRAKENNTSFDINGKIVDEKGQPLSNAQIKINILRIDPDGELGGKMASRYILTGDSGVFDVKECFGVSVNIYASKDGFKYFHKKIDGPQELKKLKDKIIILKLEPNDK